jgi:hypothetical protein
MFTNIDRKNVLNVVGAFLVAYGFVAFICFFYLVERWSHVAPTSPNPVSGQIYSHNEHGSITYLSAFEATSCWLLFATSIPLAFIGMIVSPKRNIIYRRGPLSVGAKWDPDDPEGLQRVGYVLGTVSAPIIVFIIGPALINALNAAGVVLSFG